MFATQRFASLLIAPFLLATLVQCSPTPPSERTTVAQTAPAPKPKDEDGIGGTGLSPGSPIPLDDQGIGGTGLSVEGPKPLDDQGIGGTGIIGVVTGFGSVIVNGHHIEFDPSTPVSDPAGPVDAASLRVGHIVAIAAVDRNGALTAREVFRRHPAAGPIEAVDIERGRIRIFGQWVVVDQATRIGTGLNRLAVGDSVTVSGFLRAANIIVATRIDKRDPTELGIITFPTEEFIRVFGGPPMPAGDIITAVGPIREGRIIAPKGQIRPRIPFAGRFPRLSVQGFPTALELQNLVIEGAERPVGGTAPITVDGTFAAGKLQAEKIMIGTPSNPRRDLIEKGLSEPWHLRTLPDRIEGLNERGGANPLPDFPRVEPPPAILPPRPPAGRR